jgi:hypothetical protein
MSYRSQGLVEILNQHLHGVDKVRPIITDPVTVTADSSTTGWLESAKVEAIPVDTITKTFDITGMWVSADSADDYEIIVYVGEAGSEIEIARVAYTQTVNPIGGFHVDSSHIPCRTLMLAAGERISLAVANATNGGEEVYVKLQYHEHEVD